MTKAAIEVVTVAVQAMAVAWAEAGTESSREAASVVPKLYRPTLKKPTFNCSATDTQSPET